MQIQPLRIVITGASRGLGAKMTHYFLSLGHHVFCGARSKEPQWIQTLDEHLKTRVRYQSFDICDLESLTLFSKAAAVEGVADIWINNAGVLEPIGMARALAADAIARHIQINVTGLICASQSYLAALHKLKASHNKNNLGTLINISSGAAKSAYPGWSVYCAGKAAVDQFSRVVAEEERPLGIRVHALAPGIIDTDMQALIRRQDQRNFPAVDKFIEIKKEKKYDSPRHVAEVILSLATSKKPYPDVVIDARTL